MASPVMSFRYARPRWNRPSATRKRTAARLILSPLKPCTELHPMAKYTWGSAAEWLDYKIGATTDVIELTDIARTLASLLDNDQIQDTFQPEMEADGVFNELEEP